MNSAGDLIRDGLNYFRQIFSLHLDAAVFAYQCHFVPASNARHMTDVNQGLIHSHTTHHGALSAANQDKRLVRKTDSVTMAVTDRQSGYECFLGYFLSGSIAERSALLRNL